MDKKLLIDNYLEGKHPIEQDKWELPTEGELDRDEALYDALLAERNRSPLLWRSWGRLSVSIAAAVIAVVALFTWKSQTPQPLPPSAETAEVNVAQKDTACHEEKRSVPRSSTQRAAMANAACRDCQRSVPRLKTPQPDVAEAAPQEDTVVLSNAADSLYYYLTQLENEMGECRDSACLNQLGELMRADERIKSLVNKIIHRQVETAFQEEYLIDTTTHYVPL